jgi:CRISPR-associated protein Cas6
MYWQEDDQPRPRSVADDILDVSFGIDCRMLPVDHAWPLSQALQQALPWLAEEPDAGVHLIHVAASGNGWTRPESDEEGLLYLSKRTRLTLRLPRSRVVPAGSLTGATLDIDGHPLLVGKSTLRPLARSSTLFCRYAVAAAEQTEEDFLHGVAAMLTELDIPARKLMCGRTHSFRTPGGTVVTRSLMVADLDYAASIRLQQRGLGAGRKLGFGLFLPHKGIAPVKQSDEE